MCNSNSIAIRRSLAADQLLRNAAHDMRIEQKQGISSACVSAQAGFLAHLACGGIAQFYFKTQDG
jgi:hypothetical protein